MPRLMLTDEHWSKLKFILLEDRVYDDPEHRKTVEYGLLSLSYLVKKRDFVAIIVRI